MRGEPERVVAVLHGPEPGLVRVEESDRVVEDVVEDPVEVAVPAGGRGAASARRRPPSRAPPGARVGRA